MNFCKYFRIFTALLVLPVINLSQSATDLGNALGALHDHVTGASTLSASELNTQQAAVIDNDAVFESNGEMIAAASVVVSAYESSRGPLWLNTATRDVNIPREPAGGLELERAIIAVMQGLTF